MHAGGNEYLSEAENPRVPDLPGVCPPVPRQDSGDREWVRLL